MQHVCKQSKAQVFWIVYVQFCLGTVHKEMLFFFGDYFRLNAFSSMPIQGQWAHGLVSNGLLFNTGFPSRVNWENCFLYAVWFGTVSRVHESLKCSKHWQRTFQSVKKPSWSPNLQAPNFSPATATDSPDKTNNAGGRNCGLSDAAYIIGKKLLQHSETEVKTTQLRF